MKFKIFEKQGCLLLVLFFANTIYALGQENAQACKVLLKDISENYQGECKNNLAHGKGFASGIDSYLGSFKAGLPDGTGTYRYKNGDTYTGSWKKGLKNGEGEYKYLINGKDSVITGYWRADVYKGEGIKDEGYRITNLSKIEYSKIAKTADSINVVEISFERLNRKYMPKDLRVGQSSGYRPMANMKVVITGYTLPLACSTYFTIQTSGGLRQCNFDFNITKPGKWEVLISNN